LPCLVGTRAVKCSRSAGFSLAETLIAVTILACGLLALGQLFAVSSAVVRRARQLSTASVLASQKLEELQTRVAAAANSVEDGVEYVERSGAVMHGDRAASSGAAYTRRWSIRPLASDPDHVSVIHVRVTPGPSHDDTLAVDRRFGQAGEVTLVTMHGRGAP
jgi:type II secretory pathway pseudopilin PulG